MAEEEKRKKCAFLNDWCMGDQCAQYVTLQKRNASGVVEAISLCAINALGMLMGEVDSKLAALLQAQQGQGQKLVLPHSRFN